MWGETNISSYRRQHVSIRGHVSQCNQHLPVTGMGVWVCKKCLILHMHVTGM